MMPEYLAPLVNHLWQSTLFAVAAGLLALVLRRNSARIRYWIWFAVSLKFLVPFSVLISIGAQLAWRATPESATEPLTTIMVEFSERLATPVPLPAVRSETADWTPAILLSIWLCGVAVVMCGWLRAWLRVRAVRLAASPLMLKDLTSARVLAMSAPMRIEPGVVGIFRPVLLLPEGITDRLSPGELKAIVAHELCHVRRRDNLTSAIHMVVETVFWFYPLVFWIGKRLLAEREGACDEEVIRISGDPQNYAQSILNACRFYHEWPLTCAAGVTGSSLQKRIEMIMKNESVRSLNAFRKLLLAVASGLVIVAPLALGALAGIARFGQSLPVSIDGPGFEVASVKPDPPGTGRRSGPDFNLSSGRFVARNQTLKWFISWVYMPRISFPPIPLSDERMSGGPDWIDEDRFTIEASAGREVTAPEMARMLRRLLADRFGLKVRVEARDMPTYELVRAKSEAPLGSKLKTSDECGKTNRNGIGGGGPGRLMMRCAPMALLVETLSEIVGRPVRDGTGLTDLYEGSLEYAPTDNEILLIFGGQRPADEAVLSGPSVFTALEERFGLRLVAQRSLVEHLVIEDAHRPMPN